MDFKQTNIWKRTLAEQTGDSQLDRESRARLREAFLRMREHTESLVSMIPQDCQGLTVHTISHLDALWDVADTIAGPEYPLTPAEAFVLGGAILLHDAGLTAAAYRDGITGLKRTTEWRDSASSVLRLNGEHSLTREQIDNPPAERLPEIIFGCLRALHARQAEQLATMTWPMPGKPDEQLRLLEETHLRSAYGKSIGRIAHSHHWNLDRVAVEFNRDVGAATSLPTNWTLDEVKVACLLRCADAAHIDHRRAPTMLYALTRPRGISAHHWNFQNKINQAARKEDALVYSAGSTFAQPEANAWWLCFDTVRMIDGELSSCSALMQEADITPFAVRRVVGASAPALFAKYVRTEGWRPVDAEIRVSDPVRLAQTLGGKSLYGRDRTAPLRELLQNSADAIRARRLFEPRPADWGSIRLTFEKRIADPEQGFWIHVDDNGLGMSERVLTTSLLDFGRSFWTTSLLQEEFPGLQSRGLNAIGRFGIGFFSIFLLGDRVRVTSRRFDAGLSETRTLEFESLGNRPIVRAANSGELPTDFNTRVSVFVNRDLDTLLDIRTIETGTDQNQDKQANIQRVIRRLRRLIAPLDIDVVLIDEASSGEFRHSANWIDCDAGQFLDELLNEVSPTTRKSLVDTHSSTLAGIRDQETRALGRASINLSRPDRRIPAATAYVSVGGFAYSVADQLLRASTVGVFLGEPETAARSAAYPTLSKEVFAGWASKQADACDPKKYGPHELVRAAHAILNLGGNPGPLPFCVCGGRLTTWNEFERIVRNLSVVRIAVDTDYEDENFRLAAITDIGLLELAGVLRDDYFLMGIDQSTESLLGPGANGEEIISAESGLVKSEDVRISNNSSLQTLLLGLQRIWGTVHQEFLFHELQVVTATYYQPAHHQWAMSVSKSGAPSSPTQ